MCAVGATCQKIWEGRSVADYGLIPPKYLDWAKNDYEHPRLKPVAPETAAVSRIAAAAGPPGCRVTLES